MESLADTRRIAIVGRGLIGGSIELALRQRLPAAGVIAIDRGDPLTAAAGADLVILAAPVRENIAILRQLPAVLTGDAVITDTGSSKRTTMQAALGLPSRLPFIGGHPMAGSAAGGAAAATADLFAGRLWILTPAAGCSRPHVDRLRELLGSMGAVVVEMPAEDHDRLMAAVSHLPQLAISTLMKMVGEMVGEDGLRFAGPGLRDSTRIASSSAAVWRDILESNGDVIDAALDRLIASLYELRHDHGRLPAVFEAAAHWKRTLDRSERS